MRGVLGVAMIVIALVIIASLLGIPIPRPSAEGTKDATNAAGGAATSGADGMATFLTGLSPQVWGVVGLLIVVGIVITIVRKMPFVVIGVLLVVVLVSVAR